MRPLDRPAQRPRRARVRRRGRLPDHPQAARRRRRVGRRASRLPDELDEAIARSGVDHGAEVAVEEFVDGHEGFYDTISIDGHVAAEFVTHYYPNVLEAMRTRWISPQFVTTNRIDAPGYDELRELGQRVITALGIGTSATHMEWFAGPKGLYFSEIGARPPGVRAWDLYAAANDFDIYREWANAIVHGQLGSAPSRRFAAGMIALRPDRDGSISGYDGVDELQRRHGEWVIDAHLPPPGTPTQPVEAGYMANAWVRMRHPDYDTLRGMLDDVGRTVQRPRRMTAAVDAGGRARSPPHWLTPEVARRPRRDAGEPFPVVDDGVCTFAFHGPAISVRLVHFGVGLPTISASAARRGPAVVAAHPRLPHGSRLEYKLEVTDSFGTRLIEDPLNLARRKPSLRRQLGVRGARLRHAGRGPSSATTCPRGSIHDVGLESAALGRQTTTSVYLPAGYHGRAGRSAIPLVIVHDGPDYLRFAAASTVIDNLMHGGVLPAVVVAFVHPGERLVEYADDVRHHEYLTDELLPQLERRVPAGGEPGHALPRRRQLRRRGVAVRRRLRARDVRPPVAAVRLVRRRRRRLLAATGGAVAAGQAVRPPLPRQPDGGRRTHLRHVRSVRVADLREPWRSSRCSATRACDVRFDESLDGHNWESWRDSARGRPPRRC